MVPVDAASCPWPAATAEWNLIRLISTLTVILSLLVKLGISANIKPYIFDRRGIAGILIEIFTLQGVLKLMEKHRYIYSVVYMFASLFIYVSIATSIIATIELSNIIVEEPRSARLFGTC